MKIKVLPHIDPESMDVLWEAVKESLEFTNEHPDKIAKALGLLEAQKMKKAFRILGGEIKVSTLSNILVRCATAHKTHFWTKGVLKKQLKAVKRLDDEFGWLYDGAARETLKRVKELYQQGIDSAGKEKGRPFKSTWEERHLMLSVKDLLEADYPELKKGDLLEVLSCIMTTVFGGYSAESIRQQLLDMEKKNFKLVDI